MPTVGKKKFAYTAKGKKAAKAYAKKTGKKVKSEQGYDSRLDESLGSKHGKKTQSYKSRRHESEAMEIRDHGHKYGSNSDMDYRKDGHISKKLSSLIRK